MKMTICLDLHVPRNTAAFTYRHIRQSSISLPVKWLATCGGMILGSDSHTRYGALGTMAIGEGRRRIGQNSCFAERMISICLG
mgnify:CR=1 FL=1